jgi:hypothetical protein
MIDVIYENVLQFSLTNSDLEGIELLQSKVSQKKDFEKVVKLYFNLDELEKKEVIVETERYEADDLLSNKRYLFLDPARAGSFYGLTTNNLNYLLGVDYSKMLDDVFKPLQPAKFSVEQVHKETSSHRLKYLICKVISLFEYATVTCCRRELKTPIFLHDDKLIYSLDFFNSNKNKSVFTLGYIRNGIKYLFVDDKAYVKFLMDKNSNEIEVNEDSNTGVCDFCKQEKALINQFGKKPYPLKNLKNFTSTMPSVFYANDKNELATTLRCCRECFEILSQADQQMNYFKVGVLSEERIGSKQNNHYQIYGYIDSPLQKKVDYSYMKSALESLFGTKQDALTTIEQVSGHDEIFDDDLPTIVDIFVSNYDGQSNTALLNLRNINPYLFRKYSKIYRWINHFNRFFTFRSWKGNFGEIFKDMSKTDKKISFEVFEAFLHEKTLDEEQIIQKFLPLLKRKFIAHIEPKDERHFKYLAIDILNILIINKLRKQEEIMTFDEAQLVLLYEKEDENKVKKTLYKAKPIKEIVQAMGIEWSDVEIALLDLGMIVRESVSDLKRSRDTDVEKVFMRKVDFSGMNPDDTMYFIAFLEEKFKQYKNYIFGLDNKRERLAKVGLLLQVDNNVSSERAGYLIALGYELATVIGRKIYQLNHPEKNKEKNNESK